MRILFLLCIALLFQFCKDKTPEAATSDARADTTKFFQVADYIKSQLAEINNTPYFIYKQTIEPGIKDSVAINNQQTAEIAQQFIFPDINDPSVKKYFTESVFYDQTTKNYTINYSSSNKDLEVQNLDVLLEEDGKTVKRIFIRKFFYYEDSSAIEQLSWKPNQSFQVNRMIQRPGKPEISRQTIVVWNAKG